MEYTVGGLAEKLRGLHKVRVQKMSETMTKLKYLTKQLNASK